MPNSTPLINGKTNWEIKLDELKTECDKADRELCPNRFALRFEYNARRASFLASAIQMEQQKADIESYAYRTTSGGLSVPVERKDRLPLPTGTLPPRSEYARSVNFFSAPDTSADDSYKYNNRPSTPERPESAAARPYRFQEPVKDDVEFKPPSNEQKFIQYVGMNSNCNVNIQAKAVGGRTEFGVPSSGLKAYRMFCEKCKATEQVDRQIAERYDANYPHIKDFCFKHRHTVDVALTNDSEGRKFRA